MVFSRARLAASAVGLALLTGCTTAAPMVQPTDTSAPVPDELEQYYTQELDWSECGTNFDCADVTVPMDYDEPDGETITIAVKTFRAADTAQGTLFVNPGGPGGSGIEMVENISSYFGSELLRNFDIVGFDPRGVGESSAVRCYDSAELEEYYSLEFDLETDQGWDDYVQALTDYGDACEANTGELIGHVDTISAARDLDVLRAVMGESTLTYLGYSYGTLLGATYADLFGDNVGRLVLDGAIDPSLSFTEVSTGQVRGFERAYRSYLEDCLAGADCPFSGTVDEAMQQTIDLVEQTRDTPVETSDPDRPVDDASLFNAITVTMYSPASWPSLTSAIDALLKDDGSQVQFLSDYALEREDDGTYPEDQGAFRAIDCLDYPVELDRQTSTANAEANEELSELFGEAFSYGEPGCATMPVASDAVREEIAAPGTPPIVVIGTTRDPATPYEWAEALAEQLESGVFIGYDGDGHTAYGAGSACVDEAVEAFLLEGLVPEDGLTC
ncbi:alpha/beta fold hydrolase [Ruania alkalisoli]|uniref:Alpha/beta fold hydrolase n=1 Tax=Ruania alkalisoli TaxID=2779775 RepID=A0A7M1SV06_9MICO|nr:alpha/beta hydrolase [Ruania alkalisoli]QOR71378.1 alpha/beta fold hydrolase [Ruania alkalisoli]